MNSEKPVDSAALAKFGEQCARLRKEVARIIVGQDDVVEQLLLAILARGHALLVGVPGLAKTLMVSTFARAVQLSFKRIQFTPDLMPSDITGTEVIQDDKVTGQRAFKFLQGPIFANLLLADEINRTPPKTQAALLEAMQERKVTVGGADHKLPSPFFVLATQNPIEQEGTYPLPEAQLDRFLFMIQVGYPTDAEEDEIMRRSALEVPSIEPILNGEQIEQLQRISRQILVSDSVVEFARRITRATRPGQQDAASFASKLIQWGAGPRASSNLVLAGRARAALLGRPHVTPEDIEKVAFPILRHRVLPSFVAQADGIGPDEITRRIIDEVKQPGSRSRSA
ncbi:MAG: AAA family ATPase [Gemmataceae bacterium]|jgi:MoxR-like ATPase